VHSTGHRPEVGRGRSGKRLPNPFLPRTMLWPDQNRRGYLLTRYSRNNGRSQEMRRPSPLDFPVCEIRKRLEALIISAVLFRRAMSLGLGDEVSLISMAHRSFPKSSTRSSSCPSLGWPSQSRSQFNFSIFPLSTNSGWCPKYSPFHSNPPVSPGKMYNVSPSTTVMDPTSSNGSAVAVP